jgi:hypothetical protein
MTHMAPEIMIKGRISKAADVYALGMVLWGEQSATALLSLRMCTNMNSWHLAGMLCAVPCCVRTGHGALG